MKIYSGVWSKVLLACGIIGVGLVVGVEPTGRVAFVPNEADAIIGRPLTPVSYAGVARRTVRRTAVVAGAAAYGAYGYRMATLPAGCTWNGGFYLCGSMRYRAVYDGPDVVYVQAN
jgi:hypothetical protein